MENGKQICKQYLIHNIIMNTPSNMVTDHIDGNGLNNTKSNLRICTHRQNLHNIKRKGTSKYPGVSWYKNSNKWRATIRINGKVKHLGLFTDEREAAKSYEKALREKIGVELICKMV
jgi:hypothetical protein